MAYVHPFDPDTADESPDVTDVIEVAEIVEDDEPALVPALPDDHIAPVIDLPVIAPEHEFRALAMQAKMLSDSSLVPSALRGKPHDVLLVLMTGRDLGIAPTAALRKCYVVDGQVTIAPMLKSALVKMKGAGCVRPAQDNDAEHATAIAYDPAGKEIARYTVTWDDVKDITINSSGKKLVAKDNWKNYPARMLWHRASGYIIDDIWPEISFGLYSPDEIGAITDEEGHVIDVAEVQVVDGFEKGNRRGKSNDAPPQLMDDATAEALRVRASLLPADAKPLLKDQLVEREIRGSFFSNLQSSAKVVDALITSFEKRAAGGEWGEWSPPAPDGVDADGVIVAEIVPEAEPTRDAGQPTAEDVDGTWDAARLGMLDHAQLMRVDLSVLIDACMELGIELDDAPTALWMADAIEAALSESF